MSSFPLPTLGPTITPNGITIPAYSDILASLQAAVEAIFGSDIILTPDSQDGQLLSIIAMAINDENLAAVAIYNSQSPTFAQGAALSNNVKINGIQRQSATASSFTVTVTGVAGTQIASGLVQDQAGYLWRLQGVVTIPLSGTIDVGAVCQTFGNVGLPSSLSIYTPQLGWQGVAVSGSPNFVSGYPVESDAALRARQKLSTANPAVTPVQAIIGNVANVTGVTRYQIYVNDTNATDSNGVPAHSICVVVEGGSVVDIANAIWQKKSPGTGTYGTTTQNVTDPSGVVVPVKFDVLSYVTIYVIVNAQSIAGSGYVATTATAIQTAIVNFINGLEIGEDVNYSWLVAVASLIDQAIGQTFKITTLFLGIAPGPGGTSDIAVPFNEAAKTVAANITVTVT